MEQKILEELAIIKAYTILAAKNVLTIEDLHLLLGLSKATIYRLTCEKKIPYYKKNGKLLFFDRTEVEKWALENRVITQQEAEQTALSHCLNVRRGGIKYE